MSASPIGVHFAYGELEIGRDRPSLRGALRFLCLFDFDATAATVPTGQLKSEKSEGRVTFVQWSRTKC